MKRLINCMILLCFVLMLSVALCSYAQTNGPSQPEFRKFQPVEIKDLVNEFTGAFSYSIPLMTVPGPNGSDYPITLTYNSGLSPNETASWVGFGWNLSPGAIIRNKRGWPDDFKNVNVKFLNRSRPNVTATSSIMMRPEILSKDSKDSPIKLFDVCYTTSNSFNTLNGYKNRSGFSVGTGSGFIKNCNLSASLMWDSEDNWDISGGVSFTSYALENMTNGINEDSFMSNSLSRSSNMALGSILATVTSTDLLNNFVAPNYGFTGIPTRFLPSKGSNVAIKPALNFEEEFFKFETDFNRAAWDININVTQDATVPVYGYMYSAEAEKDPKAIMDYSVERDSYYEKRDMYLGIPFSNADNFEVTGADVQGGFRLHQSQVGHFRPNSAVSSTTINSYGIMFGFSFFPIFSVNFGGDFSGGWQTLTIKGWNSFGNQFNVGYWHSTDDKFFRFSNDLGGSLLFHDLLDNPINDKASIFAIERANLNNGLMTPGFFRSHYSQLSDQKSTSITYYTFGDYRNRSRVSSDISFNDLFRKQKINDFKGISDDLIAGFSIKGKNGYTYNYGLPVFSRNEVEYSYGLNKFGNESVSGVEPSDVEVPTLVYKYLESENDNTRVVMGNEVTEPYAGQFLLTEMYSPDYIDLTGDGPTEDDLGGYVKFNYARSVLPGFSEYDPLILNKNQPPENSHNWEYLVNHKCWYKWRIPFNGLSYHKNSYSDEEDDEGTVSAGETEIYYLESIETKTFVAFFITNKSLITINKKGSDVVVSGSMRERMDGFTACPQENVATSYSDAGVPENNSKNLLRFLERIELYSKAVKNEFSPPQHTGQIKVRDLIQTVYFQYDPDYPIWKGQKNSVDGVGKLTLKRIWTENGDVKDYKISPYEFDYKYKQHDYPSEFTSLDNYGNNFVTDPSKIDDIQAPDYALTSVDRWGAYRKDDSKVRYGNNSVSQCREGSYDFDPAAWNLKSITLPSKGEIHIQYEQNRYSYVQDQNAAVLSPIESVVGNKIIIDVAKAYGCSVNKVDEIGSAAVELINKKFTYNPTFTLDNDTLLLYYKFLFRLNSEYSNSIPPLQSPNYEYISGYFKPLAVVYNSATKRIEVEFDRGIIKAKGEQYYQSNRHGMYTDRDILPSPTTYSHGYRNKDWACDNASSRSGSLSASIDKDFICKDIAANYSYIRLPVPDNWSKLGGGIRTKRILMFDKFESLVGSGNNRLYGTEYFYVDENGNPSGVASNEPAQSKEENSLVTILNKRYGDGVVKDHAITRFSFGPRDLEQFEGPLGEYLLPGPSVGYSSIYQKNIISGLKGDNVRFDGGVVRKQYFTTKDYPMLKGYTSIDKSDNWAPSFMSLFSIKSNALTRSQGYIFITNLMNGQPKTAETYAGTVFTDNEGNFVTRYLSESPSYKTEYEYYDFKEPIPIYDGDLKRKYWGVDEEIVTESRYINDYYANGKIEADMAFFTFWPKYISFGGQYTVISTILKTHVTNKILRFPAVIKSITTTRDGITLKMENYGFDRYTGRCLLTRSADEFVSANPNSKDYFEYNNISVPASQAYPQMSQFSTPQPRWVDIAFESNKLFHNWRRIDFDSAANKNRYYLVFAVDTRTPIPDDSTEVTLANWECYYTQWYKKGDILRIIPHSLIDQSQNTNYHNARNAVEAETYRVIDQKGHILELEPIVKSPYFVYPNSKMLSDIYLLKNSAENLLDQDYASFVTYGAKEKGYLNKIKKEFNMPTAEKSHRQRFNDFLNFALYAKSDGSHDNSSLDDLLYLYSQKTGISLDSLKWSFEGLDEKPVTIAYYNIDKYFKLSATRAEGTIATPSSHNATIYMDTLKLILFPYNKCNNTTTLFHLLDCLFPQAANGVLDKLITMRLDQDLPDVDWSEYTSPKNIDPKLVKRIFDVSGYTKLKNFALFFDYAIFDWKRLMQENPSNKKGKDILSIDESSIKVIFDPVQKRAVINDISMSVFSSDKSSFFTFTAQKIAATGKIKFIYNGNATEVYYPNPSVHDIFADPVASFFTSNEYGFKFYHTIGDPFSNLWTVSTQMNEAGKLIGNYYYKKMITPDTITVKLMWSTNDAVTADNISLPLDETTKVFHLDVEENRFFIDDVYGGRECDRYIKDFFGNPTSVFINDVYPRTWFGQDLTALKFNSERDTIINKAEFVDSLGNLNDTHRLISGKLNYIHNVWPNPDIQNSCFTRNLDDPYSMGERGKFRTGREYIYDDYIDDPLFASNDQNQILPGARIQDAKQYPFTYDFKMFNPDPKNLDLINSNWLKKNEISKRLNDGRIVEIIDGNGIKSSFYYGYSVIIHNIWQPKRDINGECLVPNCQEGLRDSLIRYDDDFFTLTASNAGYNEVLFQPWTASVNIPGAHSGTSLRTFDTGIPEVARGLKLGTNSLWDGSDYTKGALCRVWAKDYARNGIDCQLTLYLDFYIDWPDEQTSAASFQYPLNKVCQTGDWSLYEAEIRDINLTNYYNSLPLKEKSIIAARINTARTDLGGPGGTKNVVCDDFIIQPISSSVNSYVYNKENRRMDVTFDANHFGSYYSYNDIGEPDKVHKETLAGFRTVAQSEFNISGTSRDNFTSPMGMLKGAKSDQGSIDEGIELMNNQKNTVFPGQPTDLNAFKKNKAKNRSEFDDFFLNEEEKPNQEFNKNFDIFDLKLSPDGQKLRIMDTDFNKDSLKKYQNTIQKGIEKGALPELQPDSLMNNIRFPELKEPKIQEAVKPLHRDSLSSVIKNAKRDISIPLDSLKNKEKILNKLKKEKSISKSLETDGNLIDSKKVKNEIKKNIDSTVKSRSKSTKREVKLKK